VIFTSTGVIARPQTAHFGANRLQTQHQISNTCSLTSKYMVISEPTHLRQGNVVR